MLNGKEKPSWLLLVHTVLLPQIKISAPKIGMEGQRVRIIGIVDHYWEQVIVTTTTNRMHTTVYLMDKETPKWPTHPSFGNSSPFQLDIVNWTSSWRRRGGGGEFLVCLTWPYLEGNGLWQHSALLCNWSERRACLSPMLVIILSCINTEYSLARIWCYCLVFRL